MTEFEEELNGVIPRCINPNCDNNGTIPEEVGNNEWVAAQCEYCYTVRFPMIEAIKQAVAKHIIGEDEENPTGDQSYEGRNELRIVQRQNLNLK